MVLSNKMTAIANAIRSKTGKTGLLTLDQMPSEIKRISTDLIDDVPTTAGQWACLARASQMRDIKYTPKATMYCASNDSKNTMQEGTEYTGLPYSSVRGYDWGFIGFGVSMYSYLTALNNPKSIVYTKKYADYYTGGGGNVYNVYGTNCSEFVSYCLNLPYLQVNNIITKHPDMIPICWNEETQSMDTEALRTEMRLCDANLAYAVHGTFITGIRRDKNGVIQEVDVSDSNPPRIRKTTYSWDEYVEKMVIREGYRIYRYKHLESIPFPENLNDIVYSDICTNRGDKVCIRPNMDISLNVLGSEYVGIALFKDGVKVNVQASTADWVLTGLTTGKYTAIVYKTGENVTIEDANETNSTSFIVCNVGVSRNGNTYTYTAEAINGVYPKPMQVSLKAEMAYTPQVEYINDENFAGSGSVTFEYEHSDILTLIHVPFKTEYGFVIAECEY